MTNQLIYKNGCWGCLRAYEDPQQKYTCPKLEQHLVEYKIDTLKKQLQAKEDKIKELSEVEKTLDDMIKGIKELNKQID